MSSQKRAIWRLNVGKDGSCMLKCLGMRQDLFEDLRVEDMQA